MWLPPLPLEVLPGGRYRLSKSYRFRYAGFMRSIPFGFEWDGATCAPDDSVLRASLIHDWLLTPRPEHGLTDAPVKCGWVVANAFFYEALKAEGLPRWKAVAYFIGVKIGKWASYFKHILNIKKGRKHGKN